MRGWTWRSLCQREKLLLLVGLPRGWYHSEHTQSLALAVLDAAALARSLCVVSRVLFESHISSERRKQINK